MDQATGAAGVLSRSFATLGMYLAMAILCGFYIYHRRLALLTDFRSYVTLMASVVAAVTLGWFFSEDNFRAEIIPLLIFGMTAAIAYEKELALLLSTAIALILSFALDQGLAQFVILVSSVAAAILLLRRIRSRTKLIYVGAFTGLVVMLTTMGVGTLVGQAFGATTRALSWTSEHLGPYHDSFFVTLLLGAGWSGFCSLLAGVLMTGLLAVRRAGVRRADRHQPAGAGRHQHPLLAGAGPPGAGHVQPLDQRRHDRRGRGRAIGANGLLVRVGAYFHDIGKMLKPHYFVENQAPRANRHETLRRR